MKIITQQQVGLEELKVKLTQQFPNYAVSNRGTNILVVKKSGKAAALVMSRKGKIFVNEGFGTMGGQMVFGITMILLGVLIPLIIYYSAFYSGQKAVRNEVADFVRSQYAGN